MNRPRRQALPLETYLNKIKNEQIRNDEDVQRLAGQWDNSMINELILTVFEDNYIPPIILGEQYFNNATQLWIIEGLQRSTSFMKFRFGNYKITSAIENSIVTYQKKIFEKDGTIAKDEFDNIMWETVEFDIKNKTYSDLPEELQNAFNEYQIEIVIHEDCDIKTMNRLVRRYNNHKPMNTNQRALGYAENFARDIRKISKHYFFDDCCNFTDKEKINGTMEKIVIESVMALNFWNKWTKQAIKMSTYINENANQKMFGKLKNYLDRLLNIVGTETSQLFTNKNTVLWFMLFDKFDKLSLDDKWFSAFLECFSQKLYLKPVDGVSFDELDKGRSTKDKGILEQKLHILESLMNDFLHISKETEINVETENTILNNAAIDLEKDISVIDFVRENAKSDVDEEDIDLYYEMLDKDYDLDKTSKLLDWKNEPSLIAIIAHSFEHDIELNEWIKDFFLRNSEYIRDQKENYLHMKYDLEKYLSEREEHK